MYYCNRQSIKAALKSISMASYSGAAVTVLRPIDCPRSATLNLWSHGPGVGESLGENNAHVDLEA